MFTNDEQTYGESLKRILTHLIEKSIYNINNR